MLRVHFSHADPARIWIAAVPDTLWDIASSQHRLMSRKGRRATATLRELAIGALPSPATTPSLPACASTAATPPAPDNPRHHLIRQIL